MTHQLIVYQKCVLSQTDRQEHMELVLNTTLRENCPTCAKNKHLGLTLFIPKG